MTIHTWRVIQKHYNHIYLYEIQSYQSYLPKQIEKCSTTHQSRWMQFTVSIHLILCLFLLLSSFFMNDELQVKFQNNVIFSLTPPGSDNEYFYQLLEYGHFYFLTLLKLHVYTGYFYPVWPQQGQNEGIVRGLWNTCTLTICLASLLWLTVWTIG
jgi:hypothetical protein